jgi:ribonuclease BN (tRNA processing enzyme)
LIHEVYGIADFQQDDLGWQKYHLRMHTSTIELAHIVKEIRPDLLVLNHQLFFNNSESELLSQITKLYEGKVVSGHDLDVF